ncbi:MAG: zinc ribbon domain-containing protein [Piscinibacter sp.]|uniref:FmdB family zinc ribbon protein n=1 Tax=Piscinibacter TaxID=1114981 RepID=UPI000FDDA449|nr:MULTISPECIES: zinc ribbon domain-containing protein [Piscinibacter]MCW5665236.1 zinc ribbon domain-containing protein [Piscinibacter sp.]
MPLYDYACADCGPFRAFRPMSESALPQPCPRCGSAVPRRLAAPMLGGGEGAGWLGRPAGNARGGWRAACGFGCNHLHCR